MSKANARSFLSLFAGCLTGAHTCHIPRLEEEQGRVQEASFGLGPEA